MCSEPCRSIEALVSGLEGFACFAFDEQRDEVADGIALGTGMLRSDGLIYDRARHVGKLGSEALAECIDVLVFGGGGHGFNNPLYSG